MKNKIEIIENFYTAFSNGDAESMIQHYHPNIHFHDPAFGELQGERAMNMWRMLLSSKDASPKISFSDVQMEGDAVTAHWQANYLFGPKKRKVENKIKARFVFQEGKIIDHEDSFNVWKWSAQALGPVGTLLGWTPFMKGKIQTMANGNLDKFIMQKG